MSAIITTDLIKKYKTSFSLKKLLGKRDFIQETVALNGLSFSVGEGEIYGILGPNGAGKTTLIKVLATILLPDGGDVEILGYKLPRDEKKVKDLIGLSLGEYERTFQWRITGKQNLEFFAALFGTPKNSVKDKIDEVLSLVGLEDKADTLFLEYSTGMKHKLAIARALLNDPEVLLFDEPTAGLDAKTSREVGNFIRTLTKNGTTIIYTTHRLEEAGNLCDRILILNQGKKVAEESPTNLKKLASETEVLQIELNEVNDLLLEQIQNLDGIKDVYLTGPRIIRIHCNQINGSIYSILDLIKSKDVKINQIYSFTPSVQDAFLKLTGEEK
ncbi:MAG: ABC transporter ATP-binding protein [Candidatus Thermoplasmatota archaeon]|nr:ABC transporter ATP-binding protein [Candidatus Thermoplasmatota archaeon]